MVQNTKKKHKWLTLHFTPEELIPFDPEERLGEYAQKWAGIPKTLPQDLIDEALRFLPEQVSNRAAYDWNSNVDMSSNLVQIPLIGMTELSDDDYVKLTRSGLEKTTKDDPDGMTKDGLHRYVMESVRNWVDISLLYSAGGILDAIAYRA